MSTGEGMFWAFVGLLLLAAVFSETKRPRPASEHDYGAKEWGCITFLTWAIMALVFVLAVAVISGGEMWAQLSAAVNGG